MRLIDYYKEIMVYVDRLISGNIDLPYENAVTVIDKLIDRSNKKAIENNIDDSVWREGFFPVAAWVDETILCSTLLWREEWQKGILQRKYFGINNAGELVFQKIDKMEFLTQDMLAVYELVLAAGFKGAHYQHTGEPVLLDIRNSLSNRLKKSGIPFSSGKLFGCAYQRQDHVKINQKRQVFTLFNVFNIVTVILPVFVLIILHFLLEANLDQLIDKYYGKAIVDISRTIEVDHAKAP